MEHAFCRSCVDSSDITQQEAPFEPTECLRAFSFWFCCFFPVDERTTTMKKRVVGFNMRPARRDDARHGSCLDPLRGSVGQRGHTHHDRAGQSLDPARAEAPAHPGEQIAERPVGLGHGAAHEHAHGTEPLSGDQKTKPRVSPRKDPPASTSRPKSST